MPMEIKIENNNPDEFKYGKFEKEIYQKHMTGELSSDEYQTQMATKTINFLDQYLIFNAPIITDEIRKYINQREENLIETDINLAKKCGEWRNNFDRFHKINLKSVKELESDLDILEEKNIQCEPILEKVRQYNFALQKFDFDFFKRLHNVLICDSRSYN